MRLTGRSIFQGLALSILFVAASSADETIDRTEFTLRRLTSPDPGFQLGALEALDRDWQDNLTPAVLEFVSVTRSSLLRTRGFELLRKRTSADRGYDVNGWYSWAWEQQFTLPPYYADFKARLYERIDPRFAKYFDVDRPADIRLDEIRWGGVFQDGIPPLRQPKMLTAADATYLSDTDVIFGIEVNGDLRAYPKRILAWHEMFVDTVGGIPVVGVYCTLCGSTILYESIVEGVQHDMGTSGFLYRSNKLMYDAATQSLWNTLWGTPAVGPLVGKGIRLPRRTVVTTTWGEWRRRHPDTTVLSLDTGHSRDYDEGVAYQNYFATDELMFNSSEVDDTLANKAEVLGLVFVDENDRPLAIAAEYARAHPLIHESIGDRDFVVITDHSGAMRVYETKGLKFSDWDGDAVLLDSHGVPWQLHEDRLAADTGKSLSRLPSHSAFWFGWYGAYPRTRLLYE